MLDKTRSICKSLASNKTTILVIDKKAELAKKLSTSLKENGLEKSTMIHKSTGRGKIKQHDIYLMDTNGMNENEKAKLFKKIYRSNPKATLFVEGEVNEEPIYKAIEKYIDPIKRGETFSKIYNQNLTDIIDYVCFVENTKKKIAAMWEKLDLIS